MNSPSGSVKIMKEEINERILHCDSCGPDEHQDERFGAKMRLMYSLDKMPNVYLCTVCGLTRTYGGENGRNRQKNSK